MAKNTQGWKMPTGKEALESLKAAKPMAQVYEENFAKAVAETTKQILQQNQKQKAAVSTAAQPKQTTPSGKLETKTTKQKYEDAKKALSDYTDSDEYRNNLRERSQEALKRAQDQIASGMYNSETPKNLVVTASKSDTKEQELNALVEHYKQQLDAEESQRIRDADMKEIESWSDEDRAALEEYVRGRDMRDDPMTVSNPLRYIFQTHKVAKPYTALAEKYGEERLKELAESYSRVLHEQDAQKIVEDTTAAVDTVPGAVGHNILSVGANGIGGVIGTLGRVNEAFNRTGRYQTLEPYTPGDTLNLYASTVRGATAQNIEGEDGSAGRKALSVGYQGIMSLADSISRSLALGPAGGAALAATGSFSQTVSEATKQGASPQQAVALGVATAGMEYVSEKIPMDEVFKLAKAGDTKVLAQAFKQAGVEITTEELSLFGSMAAEAAILREKSSYKQKIGEMVANGKPYQEAKAQADKGVWNEVLQTAAVSGFAGGFSGGGAAIVGNLATNNAPEITEEVQQEQPVQTPPETPVVEPAQQTGPSAEQLLEGIQDMTPAPVPLTEEQQHFDNAAAIANGLDVEVQKNTAETGGIWDKLRGYTQHEKENWKTSKRIVLCDSIEHLRQFVSNALTSKTHTHKKMYFGAITPNLATEIQNATGVNVEGYNLSLGEDEVRKINKSHGNENKESLRGQRAVTEADYLAIPDIVQNADSIKRSDNDYEGKPAIEFQKRNGNEITTVVAVVSDKRLDVFVQTAYINKKSGSIATPEPVQAGSFTSETPGGTAPNSGDVTQTPAEGQVTSRETNARSELASPSPVTSISEDETDVNDDPANFKGTQQEDTLEQSVEGGQIEGTGAAERKPGTVGAMQSQFKREVKQSKVYGNTYQNTPYADIHDIGRAAKKADHNIDQYDVITEAESIHEAELRTETGRDRLVEHHALLKKDGWTGADNDTAMRLLTTYRREGKKERFIELSRKQRQMATQSGQMVQSFAKYSREDATVAVQDAIEDLDELTIDQVDRKFWKPEQKQKGSQGKKDAFQKWKESITGSLLEVANDIENVEDGDKASMKDLVRQIANLRHTTAWAGYSSDLSRRTERGLDKMDFDTLKTVAKTQLSMIPNDFRKRDTGEIIKQIRVQNMLFTLTTKFKNDAGNITNGIMDAVSDSFGGRMIDAIIGKFTGQRTVGNDLKFAREYSKAARDAGDVAAAFVSLDIPMESDAKYSSGRTRTWTPNTSNMFGRLMSAYEKHMKYALEVSDKFYEGGAAHVVSRSLENLGEKSGLTAEQIQSIAQKTGERRTFKDAGFGVNKDGTPKNGRAFARTNVGLQKALNNIGTENIGLGDMLMPFAAVSGEVKQVGMDYTGGGLVSGLKEMISIAKDVKNGVEIDPYRQRTAATNFGRGMTGVGLIAAFAGFAAAGAIKVHNDRDSEERMMNQTQGLSGAQWNLNSSMRWWETITGGGTAEQAAKAAEWKSGDELISVDFLEPFNTQMHVGYLLSQGEDVASAILQGNFDALLEMPMMQTFSDLADLTQAFTEISDGDMSGVKDAAGQLVGTVAGSAIPNWMRKTAQVVDHYYRNTYDTNPFKKATKEVIAATPVLSGLLPKKYDNLGKEQRRYDDGDWMTAAFDSLVTPWDSETYNTNPVYQEIERLNALDGIDVTPPQAKWSFTYTDTSGTEHKDFKLSGEQYETMQKIQGQTAMRLLAEATANEDYKDLTDKQKAEMISDLYAYAQEQAKRGVLPDYYSQEAAWIQNMGDNVADALIQKTTLDYAKNSMTATQNAKSSGFSDEVQNMNDQQLRQSYDVYSKMSQEAKAAIREEATGTMALYLEARDDGVKHKDFMYLLDGIEAVKPGKSHTSDIETYLEIRDQGVSEDQFLSAVGNIAALKPEAGFKNIREFQQREAIANLQGVPARVKDTLMKAYMDDGDTTEAKYDYCRKVLDLSPQEYVQVYRVQLDGGKKNEKIARWKSMGYTQQEANALYRVFAATGKTKIDTVAWADSWK